MTPWHESDGNMQAADGHYGVCETCWDGQQVPEDETTWECPWECPSCGAVWYPEGDEE